MLEVRGTKYTISYKQGIQYKRTVLSPPQHPVAKRTREEASESVPRVTQQRLMFWRGGFKALSESGSKTNMFHCPVSPKLASRTRWVNWYDLEG